MRSVIEQLQPTTTALFGKRKKSASRAGGQLARIRAALATFLLVVSTVAAVSVVTAVPAGAVSGDVLMVVGTINGAGLPTVNDRAIQALVEAQGLTVDLIDDNVVVVEDAADRELVVVSSSVVPGTVGSLLRDVTVPVLTWEGFLFDDFGFNLKGGGRNGETSSTQTVLKIVDDAHPIAAGYSGSVGVTTGAEKFSFSKPQGDVQTVAKLGNRTVVFAYETGAAMQGSLVAPARRVGLFPNFFGAGKLSQIGEDIVSAAVAWAVDGSVAPTNLAPIVDAGADAAIVLPINTVSLDGDVTDDGLPVPPATVTATWSQVSGPPGVTFADATSVDTDATFPGAGEYVLNLNGNDSELSTDDTVTVLVTVEPEPGLNIAYIAARDPLPTSDVPNVDHLVAAGANVTIVVDDDAKTADYSGFDLIFLSTTVNVGKIGDHFKNMVIPLVTNEHKLLDDNAMATGPFNQKSTSTVNIESPGHDLAAGFTGDVTITTTDTAIGYGTPAASAELIATVDNRAVYFAYETGDLMVAGFPAPSPRVYFPGTFQTSLEATPAYFSLLDAAITDASAPDPPVADNDRGFTDRDVVLNVGPGITAMAAFNGAGSSVGRFDSPRGVAVDQSGNIVIVDTVNHRIQTCDPTGRNCTAFGTRGTAVGQFDRPGSVAVDGSGNVIIADTDNHRIQTCDPTGANCATFGTSGSAVGQFRFPSSVAVDGSGNIVIVDWARSRIQICDPTGTNCTAFGSFGIAPGQFKFPGGGAVDHSGNIVIGDSLNHRIQVCDPTGTNCTAFGSLGTAIGQFDEPSGVAVDGSGNIIVTDKANDRVQILAAGGVLVNDSDLDGDALTITGFDAMSSLGAAVTVNGDGSYTYDPVGSAALQALGAGQSVDDAFTYTVSDGNGGTDTATVTVTVTTNQAPVANDDRGFTDEATVLNVAADIVTTAFGSEGSAVGQFFQPLDVTVDAPGNIVIADTGNHRIQVCGPAGIACTAFGSEGSAIGQFDRPSSVAIDGSGNIVIADKSNNRIQICDPTGATCTAFGSSGSAVGQFIAPSGVAVDGSGNIVVAEPAIHRIQTCDPTGTDCTAFGSLGTAIGQFIAPSGVAVDRSGNIVIADKGNHRIQICEPTGANCTAFGSFGTAIGQFDDPIDVAVDGSGNIVVVDRDNDRIQTCEPTGANCTSFGSRGSGVGEFIFPAGVAIDRFGSLVIAGRSRHRIQTRVAGGVLVNDSDAEGDPFAVTGFDATSTQGAVVAVNGDGSYTYDPIGVAVFDALGAGQSLDDTFSYTISDDKGGTDTATVTVTVSGVA